MANCNCYLWLKKKKELVQFFIILIMFMLFKGYEGRFPVFGHRPCLRWAPRLELWVHLFRVDLRKGSQLPPGRHTYRDRSLGMCRVRPVGPWRSSSGRGGA